MSGRRDVHKQNVLAFTNHRCDQATRCARRLWTCLFVVGSEQLARAAVVSHFQPNLPSQSGAEAQMIALGASADVMGIGLKKIDTELLRDIWVEWPDLGFIQEVRALLKGERTRAPLTRPGVLALSGMPYLLRSSK